MRLLTGLWRFSQTYQSSEESRRFPDFWVLRSCDAAVVAREGTHPKKKANPEQWSSVHYIDSFIAAKVWGASSKNLACGPRLREQHPPDVRDPALIRAGL